MPFESIESSSNQNIKKLRSLAQKKYRDKESLFAIEGKNLLEEALKANLEIEAVFSSSEENLNSLTTKADTKLYLAAEEILNQVSEMKTAENYIAIVKKPKLSIIDIDSNKKNLFLYCEEIQDPGNLGSIIRTAQAAGVSAIFLSPNSADIYNPKTLRSSMGSIFRGGIVYADLDSAIAETKSQNNLEIIGSSLKTDTLYNQVKTDKNILLLIGNEGRGLSPEAENSCTQLVKIPMAKDIESLNVLSAASILLFELKA